MSQTFTEFLRDKAAKESGARATIDEWNESILELFSQLRSWLSSSDPDRILNVRQSEIRIIEPRLGTYTTHRLDIQGLGQWIGIIPKARYTIANAKPPHGSVPERATGRVDITNELKRFALYRFKDGGHDSWMMSDLETEAVPLDQAAFEKAIMSFLR